MKGLDRSQVEQLRQIGDYLLKVREQQAIALEKIAQETFIPLRLLRAIETGEADRLPEPVYVRGFIRRYADALGLNGVEIADAFEIDRVPTVEPATTHAKLQPEDTTPPSSTVEQPVEWQSNSGSYLPYVLAGVAALGFVGAIAVGASNLFKPNSTARVTSAQVADPVNPSVVDRKPDITAASPSPSVVPESPPATTTASPTTTKELDPGSPVRVDIRLTADSWIEVVADGKVEYEGTMTKGSNAPGKPKKALLIRAGNAGAVVVSHNQGDEKPLGRLGDVVDVSFSR